MADKPLTPEIVDAAWDLLAVMTQQAQEEDWERATGLVIEIVDSENGNASLHGPYEKQQLTWLRHEQLPEILAELNRGQTPSEPLFTGQIRPLMPPWY